MTFHPCSRRPHRAHEWNEGAGVTLTVTLAAAGNVTLAASAAGMSRKSDCALHECGPAVAVAWASALRGGQGNEVEEVEDPPFSLCQGNTAPAAAALCRARRDRPFGCA
jgi:hypothetical protein